MESLILFSALFFMPIYALVFILTLFSILKRLKKGQELQGIEYVCGIEYTTQKLHEIYKEYQNERKRGVQ